MNKIVRFDKEATKYIKNVFLWADPAMNPATKCGNPLPVFSVLIICFVFGSFDNRLAITFIGLAILCNTALKQFIHRPRPDTIYVSRMRFKTKSFPSGHAFGTSLAYGYIAYLAYSSLNNPMSIAITSLIVLDILLIGISRVYLGAHYPTDVIGGWIFGFLCLVLAVKFS